MSRQEAIQLGQNESFYEVLHDIAQDMFNAIERKEDASMADMIKALQFRDFIHKMAERHQEQLMPF
jgi:hypothetical protein